MSLKEIASTVGTSVTTVSLVLNGRPVRVSEKKREEILRVAQAAGYTKRTIHKTGKCVGIIVPDLCNSFFSELVKETIRELQANNYNAIVCDSDLCEEKDISNLANLRQACVDGVIIATSISSPESVNLFRQQLKKLFWKTDIPVVMIDRYDTGFNTHSVSVNHYQGAYMVAEQLIKMGHRQIGCLTGSLSLPVMRDRLQGFRDALEDAGLFLEENVVEAGGSRVDGYNAIQKLLGKNITAVFAMNDEAAIGACMRAKEEGYSIPADISIVGYDDIPMSKYIEVPLTTVRQPIRLMCQQSVAIIIDSVEGRNRDNLKKNIVLQPKMIIRESVKNLNKAEDDAVKSEKAEV